ncbi:MAG: cysteine synthase A [Chloroflexota bacterium]|nr:cysteine synthase A [Chloroflexota bacterium]
MPQITIGVLDLIGNTPLTRIAKLESPGSAQVLVKQENLNPSGSVKDRVALSMVRGAEERGILKPQAVIVEPSAGNMGVSLSMIAAVKDYSVHVVMPESVPIERQRLVTRYGATIHLTPSDMGMKGAIDAARRMVEANSEYVRLDQFTESANVDAHRHGTGPEILNAVGTTIDGFVSAVGTGGTLTGVSEVLKFANPLTLCVAVEPATSPILSEGRAGDHGIVGIGADFVPPLLDWVLIDEIVTVSTQQAIDMSSRLAREEGLLVGFSSGANVYVALKLAERLGKNNTVVTILPDTGERYSHLTA